MGEPGRPGSAVERCPHDPKSWRGGGGPGQINGGGARLAAEWALLFDQRRGLPAPTRTDPITPAILGGNKEVQESVEFDRFLHRPSGSKIDQRILARTA